MLYKKENLQSAASKVIHYIGKLKGEGGLIAVDRRGNIALPFNSEGMARGFIDRDGRRVIAT